MSPQAELAAALREGLSQSADQGPPRSAPGPEQLDERLSEICETSNMDGYVEYVGGEMVRHVYNLDHEKVGALVDEVVAGFPQKPSFARLRREPQV